MDKHKCKMEIEGKMDKQKCFSYRVIHSAITLLLFVEWKTDI